MANETTKHPEDSRLVAFDEIKSQALKEAGRAHQLADKYAEQLELRAKLLETEIAELSQQLQEVQRQAQELVNTAGITRAQAEECYAQTLKVVLESFGVTLPVNAKLHYKDGVPISAEILPANPLS